MQKVKQTKEAAKVGINRVATAVIIGALLFSGCVLLGLVTVPEVVVKATGYGLIASAVIYLLRNLK